MTSEKGLGPGGLCILSEAGQSEMRFEENMSVGATARSRKNDARSTSNEKQRVSTAHEIVFAMFEKECFNPRRRLTCNM